MKFITTTNLKQWADTKDCQQMLPELVKKLINASVSKLDRLTFPSGDATFLPRWDGIVSCDEQIDIVPAGVSLWECGANDSVKSKIDSDYEKRSKDSLGYDKASSTFVFVTPRLWEGSDEWLKSHLGEWKNIVIYTAVELEDWIEKHPSVGMWLAKKLRILSSTDDKLPETYWEKWASGKDYVLPYEIVLAGREDASKQVVDACLEPNSMVIQALTQSEGIAFAIASIMSCNNAEMLTNRLIVVTEKHAYDDLVEHYDNLILLTTVTDGMNYTIKRGHTVIVASTPADQINDAVRLVRIEKEGFVKALVKIGFNKAKAEAIAKDTARDITVFRRREGIIKVKPKWVESLNDLWPAFIVGKWMDNVDGDRAILETLSGLKYDQFEIKLKAHLFEEETPLIQIRNMWRICSPYESIVYLQNWLTPNQLHGFREICLSLIQDDDDTAIEKLNSNYLFSTQSKQKYSYTIKEGAFQNLCLMSVTDNSNDGKLRYWVDDTLREMLKGWDLSRFLSNRHHFTALAESSPNCFLDFMENLPKEIFDEVFTPRNMKYSLSGWEIYYTEILFALEMLAWDVEYLNRVTALLLRFSEYKNDSNYANKPDNTLQNIFRLYLPQTYAPFDDQMAILTAYSTKYANTIYKICKNNCNSLSRGFYDTNYYYRWRMYGEYQRILGGNNQETIDQLKEVITLMLHCCDYSPETMVELLELSSNNKMSSVRLLLFEAIREHIVGLSDTQIVSDGLRKMITHHSLFPEANWSLNEMDLQQYQKLLDEIEPKELMKRCAWLFEFSYVELPGKKGYSIEKKMQELQVVRTKVLQEIIDYYGRDGIWAFIKMVKCPECLSYSLVSIYHYQLLPDICQKYKAKEINESFTKSYLFAMCRENVGNYIAVAKHIIESDNDLVIVLYAPRYVKGLAEIASDYGEDIKRRYWESIDVGYVEGDFEIVVRELLGVNRYSEAIEIMCLQDKHQMSDLEIVNVLYSYLTNSASTKSQMDSYHIEMLLERLDRSEDPEVIRVLIVIEFLLFRVLEHQMDISKTRFVKELSRNPDLMIQLVELAYIPDDGTDEQKEEVSMENKRVMGECAFHILHFGQNIVSFTDDNGNLDESFMCEYIERLYKLAKERKRNKVIEYVIGDILGDIPRDDNYPPIALCRLVERLNSDKVDQEIRIRIINSRGMTTRSYNEGGDQERVIVARFKKYKEKTKLLYPRMTKILEGLIKEYSVEAAQIDVEATIEDLEY